MKVALLGATGFVGSALLNEALSRGHTVTAIARDVGKLPQRDALVVKACDLFDTTALAELLRGHDAVISAFNPGWKNPHLYQDQVRGAAFSNNCASTRNSNGPTFRPRPRWRRAPGRAYFALAPILYSSTPKVKARFRSRTSPSP